MLVTEHLTLGYEGTVVVPDLSLAFETGKITTLIGPNGCGKSTLLRSLARLHAPTSGVVLLDGDDIRHRPTREVARRLGFLAQHSEGPEGLTVADLVRRGRFPHRGVWEPLGPDDEAEVARALDQCGLAPLAHRRVDELSGGQRQRAWIALTLAQETPLILLDEPTTFLDAVHQKEVLDLVLRLNQQEGKTFVLVLHDLAQVRRISHRVTALKAGRVLHSGEPDEVLNPEVLAALFDVAFDAHGPVPGVKLGRDFHGGAPKLEARGLVAGYTQSIIGPVEGVLGPGGLTVIVGPNGCGKSTLLRTLAGLQKPLAGTSWLERPVASMRPRELAARRAFVQQDSPLPAGFTVEELLRLGGHHRRGLWGREGAEAQPLARALEALHLKGLETRRLDHLSGGQRQRVWLALALVQNAPLLLLDEPTSFLDPRHQRDLLDALWTLTRETPTTVVAILHEPELARRYADRIIDLGGAEARAGRLH